MCYCTVQYYSTRYWYEYKKERKFTAFQDDQEAAVSWYSGVQYIVPGRSHWSAVKGNPSTDSIYGRKSAKAYTINDIIFVIIVVKKRDFTAFQLSTKEIRKYTIHTKAISVVNLNLSFILFDVFKKTSTVAKKIVGPP